MILMDAAAQPDGQRTGTVGGSDSTSRGAGRIEYLVRRLHGELRSDVRSAWRKGRILIELKALAGYGDWGVQLRMWGVAPTSDWRWRKLAVAYETEEEAGRYRSVGRALCAARPDADTCPRCQGRKHPEYQECQPCSKIVAAAQEEAAADRKAKRQAMEEVAMAGADEWHALHAENTDLRGRLDAAEERVEAERERADRAEEAVRLLLLATSTEDGFSKTENLEVEVEVEPTSDDDGFSKMENLDWPEVEPTGRTRRVVEHCRAHGAAGDRPWFLPVGEDKRPTVRWSQRPYSLEEITSEHVALVPGSLGLRCLDVDSVEGVTGDIPFTAIQPLIDLLGMPVAFMRSLSGRGWHLYWRTSRRVGNATFRYRGVAGDVRDSRGYALVADPARILDLVGSEDLLREEPVDDWSALLPPKPVPRPATVGGPVRSRPVGWTARLLDEVAAAGEGARNETLNRVTYALAAGGADEAIKAELFHLSPLPPDERKKVIARAWEAGLRVRAA